MPPSKSGFLSRLATLLLVGLLAMPAAASPLDDAKSAGEVGEQPNGYLGIVRAPGDGAIQALVASINAERRSRYESIAARNGISLEQVEMLAGKKAIEKTSSGQWIRLPDGTWTPK